MFGQGGTSRAYVTLMYLQNKGWGQGNLDISGSLGHRIMMEEHAHSYPQVMERRSKVDIGSLMNDQRCKPRNDHNRPWFLVPCVEAIVSARILTDVKGSESNCDDILPLLECDAPREYCL